MPQFEIYRLLLSPPKLGPLLQGQSVSQPQQSREEYLRSIFSTRQDFFYSHRQMAYAPSPTETQSDTRLSGFLGRKASQPRGGGPEVLFAETQSETWRASFLTVDVSSDQQLVFFERRFDVGSGHAILEALFDHVARQRKATLWHVDIEYVWTTADFWEAANRHRGEITEMIFVFAPYNGLFGFDRWKDFDKLARQETNADQSSYALKNENAAIEPSGEFVESAVEYASEGGGEAILKHGRRRLFSSRKSRKTQMVPETLMPRQREPAKILGLIGYLFGRRKSEADD